MSASASLAPNAAVALPLRGDVLSDACPSREVLKHLTSRWGGLVLLVLHRGGILRFSDLRRSIGGISERMLAQTLQLLEADGFVHRTDHQTVPPHVDYRLTSLGTEAAIRMHGLIDWIETNMPRFGRTEDPA